MVRARKTPADGRVNSGGARQGKPGQSYSNRSDLRAQKVQVATGQEYGKATEQRRAQQAVPMAGTPPPPSPAGGAQIPYAGPMAGEQGPLLRPTERPDEPVTAGVPFGPGPAGPAAAPDPLLAQLQAAYGLFPTQDLADLIEDLQMRRGFG